MGKSTLINSLVGDRLLTGPGEIARDPIEVPFEWDAGLAAGGYGRHAVPGAGC